MLFQTEIYLSFPNRTRKRNEMNYSARPWSHAWEQNSPVACCGVNAHSFRPSSPANLFIFLPPLFLSMIFPCQEPVATWDASLADALEFIKWTPHVSVFILHHVSYVLTSARPAHLWEHIGMKCYRRTAWPYTGHEH